MSAIFPRSLEQELFQLAVYLICYDSADSVHDDDDFAIEADTMIGIVF